MKKAFILLLIILCCIHELPVYAASRLVSKAEAFAAVKAQKTLPDVDYYEIITPVVAATQSWSFFVDAEPNK